MNTWYIFDVLNEEVWCHNLVERGERCFIGSDGQFHPRSFGYVDQRRAEAQAASLRQTHYRRLEVIDREALFDRLNLVDHDWSHLKDQRTPAQRRRQEKRQAADDAKAAIEALRQRTTLVPRGIGFVV